VSGTLGFKYFPSATWLDSGVYTEFDPSQANTATQNQRALIVGQITSSGTATANTPVMAYSQSQVNGLCGNNSMLALMYAAYRAQDPFGECWIGPLADNGGGSSGTGTITFTGPATAAGTLPLYIMGVSVPVAVSSGDTATTIATNTTTAITAAVGICATATSSSGVVTITASHKGAALNDIDLRIAYRGVQNGEAVPAGVTVAFNNTLGSGGTLSGGATNPVLTTLFANCGSQTFDFIAFPYTDSTSLTALETFLSDQSGRWSAIIALYGHAFTSYRGTVSARGTFGNTRNSQHVTCLGYYDSPTPAWLEAADFCGAHAIRIRVNPAQGVSEQALGLLPPPIASQDNPGNRNVLLFDGVTTFYVDPSGTSRIDRSVTMYQTNASGQPDNSYRNTNLLFQAMYVARYLNTQISSQFIATGKILVSNGTPIPMGAPATTPNLILQAVIGMYSYLCSIFVVQNPQTFAKNAYAATGTKGQVLLYCPLDFADQVIQVAVLAQFVQST
jgi:phage tail sheath gpL-like